MSDFRYALGLLSDAAASPLALWSLLATMTSLVVTLALLASAPSAIVTLVHISDALMQGVYR